MKDLEIPLNSLCPVCNSSEIKPKWSEGLYKVYKCRDCTAMFVVNRPSIEELIQHYGKGSDPAYDEDNKRQLCYYYDQLGKIIRKILPQGKKIFDVGCSRGWFFDSMNGWECHGNELNELEAKEAQKKYGENILHMDFQQCPDYSIPFDVVAVQDVLDHFINPVGVVQKANKLLSKGGVMVIKVHDWGCLYARVTGKKFYAYIPPSHLTFFNKKSLHVLCEKNGFKIIQYKHYPQLLSLPKVFYRLSQGKADSFFGQIHLLLEKTVLRRIIIKKNLHDIVTLFAVKTEDC
jgi:YD repeat-containing protein